MAVEDPYNEFDVLLKEIDETEQKAEMKQTHKTEQKLPETDILWDGIVSQMKSGNINYIKNLISSKDIDINTQNPSNGMALIHYAVIIGNYDLVKAVCNFGANTNATDHNNHDALFFAIKYGRYRITELLYYQALSGSLGLDLKSVAAVIHEKNEEAKYFIETAFKYRSFDEIGGSTYINGTILFLIKAIEAKRAFSADLLYYMWYFICTNCETPDRRYRSNADQEITNPMQSELFKVMMETFESILSDTSDKHGWEWLKKHFITSLIWYLPHPRFDIKTNTLAFDPKTTALPSRWKQYIQAETQTPYYYDEQNQTTTWTHPMDPNSEYYKNNNESKDNDDSMETILKSTLFYELLARVRTESKKQSGLLLKEKIDRVKEENADIWKRLRTFNVTTVYSDNARQDLNVKGCLQPRYTQDDLNEKKYPPSTHFSAKKHYDTQLYLNELLFNANILDNQFQEEMRKIAKDIAKDKDIKVHYRRGPVKTLKRSQTKVENDYIDEKYPTSAKLLDINRCALEFGSIECMLQFLDVFEDKIKSDTAYGVVDVIRCKNGWTIYDENHPSYTDIKLNVLVQSKINGVKVIAEIQFLLNLMSAFKKKAHKLYAVERKFEFVYNFARLKNKMKSFVNMKDTNNVLINLAQNDDIYEFKLLWSLIKDANSDTLCNVNDKKDKKDNNKVSLLYVIQTNGKILNEFFLGNKDHKQIYYESIAKYIDEQKNGLVEMLTAIGVEKADIFLRNLFESIEGNLPLKKKIYLSTTDKWQKHNAIDWSAQNNHIHLVKILLKYVPKDTIHKVLTKANIKDRNAMTIAVLKGHNEIALQIVQFCENNGTLMMDILKGGGDDNVMSYACRGNYFMVQTILNQKCLSTDDKIKLIISPDKYNKTALYKACAYSKETYSNEKELYASLHIVEELMRHINDDAVKADLIVMKDRSVKSTALNVCIKNKHYKVASVLLREMKGNYAKKLELIFNDSLRNAVQSKEMDLIEVILSHIEDIGDKKKLLYKEIDHFKKNIFHIALSKDHDDDAVEIIKLLFGAINNNVDDIFNLITYQQSSGESPFLKSCLSNFKVAMLFLDYFKDDTARRFKLLSMKYKDNHQHKYADRTALMAICKSLPKEKQKDKEKIFKTKHMLLEYILSSVKSDEMLQLLNEKIDKDEREEYNGNTCLMYTVTGPTFSDLETIKILLNYVITKYDEKIVYQMLTECNDNGNTVLMIMCAAHSGQPAFDAFTTILQMINNKETVSQLLRQKNKKGKTCYEISEWHMAVQKFLEKYYPK